MAFVEEQDPPPTPEPPVDVPDDEPIDLATLMPEDVATIILVGVDGQVVNLDNMAPHAIDVCLFQLLGQKQMLVGLETEGGHLLSRLQHRFV